MAPVQVPCTYEGLCLDCNTKVTGALMGEDVPIRWQAGVVGFLTQAEER